MAIRIVSLFLTPLSLSVLCLLPSAALWAQTDAEDPLAAIIAPDLERRTIASAEIDSENWEFGIYTGVMSIEDFGTSSVTGLKIAYHVSENFFTEASYALTEAGETSFETLSGATQILTDEQREISYYQLSFGYNLFQGEIFLGTKRAYNADFYLVAGAGNTEFADDSYFTYSLGLGSRFYLTDWLALHSNLRAHSFSHELLGEEKTIVNLEPQVGMTFYF